MNIELVAFQVVKYAPTWLTRNGISIPSCVISWIRRLLLMMQHLHHPLFESWPFSLEESLDNLTSTLQFCEIESIPMTTHPFPRRPCKSAFSFVNYFRRRRLEDESDWVKRLTGATELLILSSLPNLLLVLIYGEHAPDPVLQANLNCIRLAVQHTLLSMSTLLCPALKTMLECVHSENQAIAYQIMKKKSPCKIDIAYIQSGVENLGQTAKHLLDLHSHLQNHSSDLMTDYSLCTQKAISKIVQGRHSIVDIPVSLQTMWHREVKSKKI